MLEFSSISGTSRKNFLDPSLKLNARICILLLALELSKPKERLVKDASLVNVLIFVNFLFPFAEIVETNLGNLQLKQDRKYFKSTINQPN